MPQPQAGWTAGDYMDTLPQAPHQPPNLGEPQQTSRDEPPSSVRWQGLPCSAPCIHHLSVPLSREKRVILPPGQSRPVPSRAGDTAGWH